MKRTKTVTNHLILITIVIALVVSACGNGDSVDIGDSPGNGDSTLPGGDDSGSSGTRPTLRGNWELRSLTIDGADLPLPGDEPLVMTIERGTIAGSGGCNSFGGRIDAGDDGSLTITEMAWTEMACLDTGRMDFETAYLPALSRVTRWEAGPDGITFSSDAAVIVYGPGREPVQLPLEGTAWVLDTIFSGEGVERAASTTDMSKPEATVRFADGTVTITADDCEVAFPLNYEPGRDGNVTVPEAELRDRPSCPDDKSNVVVAVEGIWEASGFMIDENRLTMIGLPGELIGLRGS